MRIQINEGQRDDPSVPEPKISLNSEGVAKCCSELRTFASPNEQLHTLLL